MSPIGSSSTGSSYCSNFFPAFLILLSSSLFFTFSSADESAVRVVRFRVDYPEAELESIQKLPNWSSIMRKSVLASLRFVNKHWLLCGEVRSDSGSADKGNSGADCGKLQVTGEEVGTRHYRINATFIANRDPVRNAKVEANSSAMAVLQIGLKGGIFQYTNAMKVLGKPGPEMPFEEAFFCYPGGALTEGDKCRNNNKAATKALRRMKRSGKENGAK